MLDDDGLHELRMGAGNASMAAQDAIDEDFVALLIELRDVVSRTHQHLMDHGLERHTASGAIAAAVFGALAEDGARD